MSIANHKWYALHVRPNYELTVSSRLKDLGVEHYLPVQKRPRVAQRNKFNDGPPLFPGYVFSYLNLSEGPRLYLVPGVLRILGHGGRSIPLEDAEIATLRTLVDSPLQVEATSYFHAGEKVSLIDGPLKGITGTFLHTAKGDKLVVSIPLLRRALAVAVMSDWVAAGSNAVI